MTEELLNAKTPLHPEIGLLALVPDEWSDQWQARHHILSRLSHYYHVVWLNPPHHWRESVPKLRARKNAYRSDNSNGLLFYTPEWWLPHLHRPRRISNSLFRARLRRALALLIDKGCNKTILSLWRPEFGRAIKYIPYDLSCYHVDDDYSFSDVDLPSNRDEMQLLRNVDQVFIHSPGLMEKKGGVNSNTCFFPNGVDYKAYASIAREPEDLAAVPHPRIGYAGHLKKMLDWQLLNN